MYSLDGGLAEEEEPAWGPEEEEESDEVEEEVPAAGGRRLRPGRQERAARRRAEDADAEEESEGDGDEPLDVRMTTLYRAAAARANYLTEGAGTFWQKTLTTGHRPFIHHLLMTKYKRSRLQHQSHAEDRVAKVPRAVSCDLGSSLPSSPTRSISDPLLRERPLEGAEASVTEFPEGGYNR